MLIGFQQLSADLIQFVKEVVSFSALDLALIDVIVPVCVNKLQEARLVSAANNTVNIFQLLQSFRISKCKTNQLTTYEASASDDSEFSDAHDPQPVENLAPILADYWPRVYGTQ